MVAGAKSESACTSASREGRRDFAQPEELQYSIRTRPKGPRRNFLLRENECERTGWLALGEHADSFTAGNGKENWAVYVAGDPFMPAHCLAKSLAQDNNEIIL